MTARILVVDDILPNVKLLEAKLSSEYFDVITAMGGKEAIEKAEAESPDLILLDIMMPDMNGFEVCKHIKNNPKTSHIPVVMVTALTDAEDRVSGLEVGADDFLSKPVDDIALMARVRSLVRLKMIVDEWRVRENTSTYLGLTSEAVTVTMEPSDNARILLLEDKSFEVERIREVLAIDNNTVVATDNGREAIQTANESKFDLIVVSLNLAEEDGLRMCSLLRSNESSRSVPILAICEEGEMNRVARSLEVGAHDYILRPVDVNEFLARVRTQVRKKRYQNRLKNKYKESLSLAVTDSLTGLYNRRYLLAHLEKLIEKNFYAHKFLCVMILDIDHFKSINDNYGHDVGDTILKTFASRINMNLRNIDLMARQGGEEFCVVLPDVGKDVAIQVAERVRTDVCSEPFKINDNDYLDVSVSIGAVLIGNEQINPEDAIKQADIELYNAKENGRNRVYFSGDGCITKG